MSDKVKIGVIGVGQIGLSHLHAYRELPVEIVAISDINPDARNAAAEQFGIARTFADFRELLQIEEIQAVDVCLHNNLHAPITLAAFEAGKHVYCEKPIAGSYADGAAMVAAAKRTGRRLAIQMATLYAGETRAAQRLIEGGYLGKLYYAKSIGFRRRGRCFVDGYGSTAFVQKSIAAGGALFDMGVYHIGQLLYLLGNPAVQTISGTIHQEIDMYPDRRSSSHFDVEELGLGFARLEGGITLSIEESWALNGTRQSGSEVFGAKGGLCLSPFSYHTTLTDIEMDGTFDLKSAVWRWKQCVPNSDAYESSQAHWVAALQGRVPLIDSVGIALTAMKITEGIFLSSSRGVEVTAEEVEQSSKSSAIKV